MALPQNQGFCQKKSKSQMPYDIQVKPPLRKLATLASTSGPGEVELGGRTMAAYDETAARLEMHGCQSGTALVSCQCF